LELRRGVYLEHKYYPAGQTLRDKNENAKEGLTRISHQISTAAADPGMSTALRSVGLLDILSSMPAGPSFARLVSMPVCAASLRNLLRK